MTTIAGQLPPEIARQLHPDRLKNEEGYWAARDELLASHHGQWVGFADGAVIASGTSPVAVFHAAEATGQHPFLICVGKEDQPSRVRRAAFPYDTAYAGEPLPLINVEFRTTAGQPGITLDRVIPDTGADASVLPWSDCQSLQLIPAMGVQSLMSGIAGGSSATLVFRIWVLLDGRQHACRLQADFTGTERILGRDVLNRMPVLFDGPSGLVVFNP